MTDERLAEIRAGKHGYGYQIADHLLAHIDTLQERIADLEADTVWANFSPATVRTKTATAILRDIGNCNCANCERMRDICRAHGAKE